MSFIPDKDKRYRLGPLFMEQVGELEVLLREGALIPVKPGRYWMAMGQDELPETPDTIYSETLGCELIAVQAILMPDTPTEDKG